MDLGSSKISYVLAMQNFASKRLSKQSAILLTCYHLTFATVMTQIVARTSSVLDGRHSIPMTPGLYMRAILPIGVLYSFSLVCSNLPYLYLSVAFIQMLKVCDHHKLCSNLVSREYLLGGVPFNKQILISDRAPRPSPFFSLSAPSASLHLRSEPCSTCWSSSSESSLPRSARSSFNLQASCSKWAGLSSKLTDLHSYRSF